MSDDTPIEWTDATWPIVAGCAKKTRGCKNCWAIRTSWRLSHNPNASVREAFADTVHKVGSQLAWTGLVRPLPQRLDWPLKWKQPRKIFVCSQSDLFHPSVPFDFIDEVFAVIALCTHHTFQILTKEPDRMLEYLSASDELQGMTRDALVEGAAQKRYHDRNGEDPAMWLAVHWPLPNVLLGTSVENQECADARRPPMRELANRGWLTWISNEPALGPVDWTGWQFIKWMVSGGESGPKADPSHPDWFRRTRDWCAAHAIDFLFKQYGNWQPGSSPNPKHRHACIDLAGRVAEPCTRENFPPGAESADGWTIMANVGKKAAGRTLDGRTHDGFPT